MSNPIPTLSAPSISIEEAADRVDEMPRATPPSEWQIGEEQLSEQQRLLRNRVDERLRTLLGNIEEELFAPLQAAAHEAAAVHVALVRTSHFDESVADVPPHLRWSRVRDYRRDTMKRVIAPLQRQLAELDLGAALDDRWQAYWNDLAALPPRMPVSIKRQEPEGLYTQSLTDSFGVAIRKHLVQIQRRFRLGNDLAEDGNFYAQEVPLRGLAAYHLRVRLPEVLDAQLQDIRQHFARTVAAFERAATTWTHRLLDAERHLTQPHYHLPKREGLTGSEDTDGEVSSMAPEDIWAAVRTEAAALNKQLQAMSSLDFEEHPAHTKAALRSSWSELEADIKRADSFLLPPKDRALPPAVLQSEKDATSPWATWYRQAADRIAFCRTLSALRDAIYEQHELLLSTVLETGVRPLQSAYADAARSLRAVHDEAVAAFENKSQREALSSQLTDLFDRATHIVNDTLVSELRDANVLSNFSTVLDNQIVPSEDLLQDHPSRFQLHALARPSASTVTPDIDVRDVDLQNIVREHFDSFFSDDLHAALKLLHRDIERIIDVRGEIADRLNATLDGALDKLETAAPDEGTLREVQTLVLNSLARAAEALEDQQQQALNAFTSSTSGVGRAFATSWTDLHDRARVDSRVREYLLELRTIEAHERQNPTSPADAPVSKRRLRLHQSRHRDQKATQAHEPAQRSATHAVSSAGDRRSSTNALVHTEQVISDFPRVYRRLFSFQPLTDPALLAGRQDDINHLQRCFEQWPRSLTRPLVLTGPPGSGLTSFLNVAQKSTLQDADVHWLKLNERLQSTTAFAERIAQVLDLPLTKSNQDPLTLEAVRAYLLDEPQPETPRVAIVEHLEHLFLRTVGGTDLVGRVLTFMSRTASRVLWISSVSELGWQYLVQSTPAASRLMHHHALAPMDRTTLETLIMARHRRSGLQITFEPPEEPSATLRRRLQKTQTEEHTQAVLQTAFFDELYAQCRSNIVLALFNWLRAARLDDESLVMHIRPTELLHLDVLEDFSMPQTLLLKTLLDHATLTVEEYASVGHVPEDTSLTLFESLSQTRLLEPYSADKPDAHAQPGPIEPGRRYRLRPLVIQPIMQYLRRKNLLS